MGQMTGKVALIHGAGSGIGAAAARLLAKEGARVAITSRTQEDVDEVAESIRKAGGECIGLCEDVSVAADVERVAKAVLDKWGAIHVLFHNAGINGTWGPIEKLTEEDFHQTVNVNLLGTFLACKAAIPVLKRQGGSVIITSSINGTRSFTNVGSLIYSATKAAQVSITKQLALECAPQRVRFNVICPGAIETNINETTEKVGEVRAPMADKSENKIPLTGGKPGTADDVAQAVLFLASDASRHITGTELWIDGGQSLLI